MKFSTVRLLPAGTGTVAVIGAPHALNASSGFVFRSPSAQFRVPELFENPPCGLDGVDIVGVVFVVDRGARDVVGFLADVQRRFGSVPILCIGVDVAPTLGYDVVTAGACGYLETPLDPADVAAALSACGVGQPVALDGPRWRIIDLNQRPTRATAAETVPVGPAALSDVTISLDPERSPTVLVAEDDGIVALSLRRLFRRRGWFVRCENSALGAIEALKSHRWDLVIADVHLGDDRSDELIRLARAVPPTRVALMSAGPIEECDVAYRLRKPIAADDVDRLIALVERSPACG